jgi:hypothetical protein
MKAVIDEGIAPGFGDLLIECWQEPAALIRNDVFDDGRHPAVDSRQRARVKIVDRIEIGGMPRQMHMRIDDSRQDIPARSIEDLVGLESEIFTDLDDLAILDRQVGLE